VDVVLPREQRLATQELGKDAPNRPIGVAGSHH
jgi:hypothetical protein